MIPITSASPHSVSRLTFRSPFDLGTSASINAEVLETGTANSVIGIETHGRCSTVLKRPKFIFGKPQSVDDLPANGKLCQSRDRKCPYHLIAKAKAPSGLRRKGAGEAFSASLLLFNKRAQARFIVVEGLLISPARFRKLSRQNVGRDHRQCRALSGQQGD